ncbi:MAG: SCO family protein [Chloroflexota bacterium]
MLRKFFYLPLFLLVVTVLGFSLLRPITVLPRITLAPGYAFTDPDGRLVTSEDFRGKLTLYSFSYSHCLDDCPLPMETLATLRQQLEQSPTGDVAVSLVTISLDPERDTPAELSEWVGPYEPAEDALIDWRVLSGDVDRTRYVVGNGFEVYYNQGDRADELDYAVDFEPRFVLVDGWGIMRAIYRTAAPDPLAIMRDLRLLQQEARHSQGVGRLAYEAAHLFLCYPR